MKHFLIPFLILFSFSNLFGQADSTAGVDTTKVQINDEAPEEAEEVDEPYQIFQVQTKAEFKGGEAALYAFISNNLEYPTAALEAGVGGRVTVAFVVEKDGSIHDVKIFGKKRVGFGTEEAAIGVVRKTSGMWTPAVQRDRNVRMRFMLPIVFSAPEPEKKKVKKSKVNSDTLAVFEGGKKAFRRYVKYNMEYPSQADVEGTVLISFTVKKDGSVSDVRIVSKTRIGHGYEEEAMRLIKGSSGMWLPGTLNKKAIKSKLIVPIRF
jgi:periplasmic protein TonB